MDNNINEEQFTFNSVLIYIKNNFIGLLMFILVFFIIYIVDHINRINSLLFSVPGTIPNISNSIPVTLPKIGLKEKKNKKR